MKHIVRLSLAGAFALAFFAPTSIVRAGPALRGVPVVGALANSPEPAQYRAYRHHRRHYWGYYRAPVYRPYYGAYYVAPRYYYPTYGYGAYPPAYGYPYGGYGWGW